jgi:phosphate transport system substrate-binding protein
LALVGALALTAAACGSDNNSTSPGGSTSVTGSVNVSGSSTVQPISSLVAETFAGANPDVNIMVNGPGTGDGFVLFCEGKTDINDASRPIEDSEAKDCKNAGIHYVELKIGLDGITLMTNPSNDAVTCLTTTDLYALFGPESTDFKKWSDANALDAELGGAGTFPDDDLTIIAPGTESGTYDAFIELVGIEDTATSQGVPAAKAATLRTDYQSSANDNQIIQGIEGSPTALGFTGFAFADLQGDKVKKLGVDAGDGCIEPTTDTIADGSYPLSRSLYVYVNTDNLTSNDALKAYVDYYLSDEGITSVTDADYVAIPADQLVQTRDDWAAVTTAMSASTSA